MTKSPRFAITPFVLAASLSMAPAQGAPRPASLAEYRVPVSQGLEAYANFVLADAAYEEHDGKLSLHYRLPAELVGSRSETIVFAGAYAASGDLVRLAGPAGEASCTEQRANVVCLMNLKYLKIAPGAADAYLEATVRDPSELIARKQVAALFMSDPIGIVTYRR